MSYLRISYLLVRVSAGCLNGVWKVSGICGVSGGFLEAVWRVVEGCLEGVHMVSDWCLLGIK